MHQSNSQLSELPRAVAATSGDFINNTNSTPASAAHLDKKYSSSGKRTPLRHSLSTDLENSLNFSGNKPRSSSCLDNYRYRNKSFNSGKFTYLSPMVTPQANTSSPQMEHNIKDASNSTPDAIISSEEIDDQWSSVAYQSGSCLYHNRINGERWWLASDSDGNTYYYEEKTNQSAWSLPTYKEEEEEETLIAAASVREATPESPAQHIGDRKSRECLEDDVFDHSTTDSPPVSHRASLETTSKEEKKGKEKGKIDKDKISGPVNSKLNRSERHARVAVYLGEGDAKKSFKDMNILLTGPKILFYKDPKAMQPKPNHPDGKPEFSLNIQDIDFYEMHYHNINREFLIEFKKTDGFSTKTFLLDMKTKSEQECWMSALKLAKEWTKSDMFSKNNERIRYDMNRSRSVRGNGLPEATVNKLNVFLKRRPTKEDLREIGIFRDETVFGNLLTNICDREGVTVPKFVTQCINAIHNKGLSINGLYRVSGNSSLIQSLRCMVDQNPEYNLLTGKWGPYDLADSLKLFFRELREPLFVTSIYDELIDSVTCKLDNVWEPRTTLVKRVLSKLPQKHYDTAHCLFHHLYQVALKSKENQMNSHNLAIVFGLNLMCPPIKSPANQSISARANTYMVSCKVVEYLLDSTPEIFPGDRSKSCSDEVTSTSL